MARADQQVQPLVEDAGGLDAGRQAARGGDVAERGVDRPGLDGRERRFGVEQGDDVELDVRMRPWNPRSSADIALRMAMTSTRSARRPGRTEATALSSAWSRALACGRNAWPSMVSWAPRGCG